MVAVRHVVGDWRECIEIGVGADGKCSHNGQLPGEGHEKLLPSNAIREFGVNKRKYLVLE